MGSARNINHAVSPSEDVCARLLHEEISLFWDIAQERFQEEGRGCLLIGRSQSLAELHNPERSSMYLVDYLSQQELHHTVYPIAEGNQGDAAAQILRLLETYEPTREIIVAFFGGNGFENVYRVRYEVE